MDQPNGAGLQFRHMFRVLDAAMRVAALVMVTGEALLPPPDNLTLLLCLALLVLADTRLVLFLFLLLNALSFLRIQPAAPLAVGILFLASVLRWKGCLFAHNSFQDRCLRQHVRAIRGVVFVFLLISLALFLFRPITWWLPFVWFAIFLLMGSSLPATHGTAWSLWLPNLALVLISSLLALAGAETVARATRLGDSQTRLDIWMRHPLACFTLRPATAAKCPRYGGDKGVEARISYRISSQGLRDREYGPRAADEFRILILGDSFTMGWGLEVENGYVKKLERRLEAAHLPVKVSVLNGGCGAYGPWQELLFLRERGLPLGPCLVIHELYLGNDIENTLQQSEQFLHSYDAKCVRAFLDWRKKQAFPVHCEDWAENHSALYRVFSSMTRDKEPLASLLWNTRFAPPSDYISLPGSERRPPQMEVTLQQWYPALEKGWQMVQQDILAIRDECASHGVDFAAFAIPDQRSVCSETWQWIKHEFVEDTFERYKDIHVAEEFYRRQQIPYISLENAFVNAPNDADLYFPYDGHFTDAGTDLVAAELERFVLETWFAGGCVPRCASAQPAP